MDQMYTGFIGLGEMGGPMAKNLISAGISLLVFDINKEAVRELESLGAKVAGSPKEVAAKAGIIISIVRDAAQTEQVLFGAGGVAEGLSPGKVVLMMSTIDPLSCVSFGERLQALGVDMVDAPVSGARAGAEAGTLTIMVGGKPGVIEKVRKCLEVMGKNIIYLGGIGTGQAAKLTNNLILAANLMVAEEGFALGLRSGLTVEQIQKVISVSTGGSWVANNWAMSRTWWETDQPGRTLDVLRKDVWNGLALAKEYRMALPMCALGYQMMFTKSG